MMEDASPGLKEAAAIWNFLDSLAEQSPENYQSFITKTMQEASHQGFSVPQEFQYIETEKVPEVIPKRTFFVNIVKWSQSTSKHDTSKPQLAVSAIREEIVSGRKVSIVDVAGPPGILSDDLLNSNRYLPFHEDIISFVENQKEIKLNKKFRIFQGYFGNKDCLFNFMCPQTLLNGAKQFVSTPDPTIKLQSELQPQTGFTREDDSLTLREKSSRLTKEDSTEGTKVTRVKKYSKVPKHTLDIKPFKNKVQRKMTLEVELPGVTSVSSCNLELFEDFISVRANDMYAVDVPLPCSVNDDEVHAQFIKSESKLIVTMLSR